MEDMNRGDENWELGLGVCLKGDLEEVSDSDTDQ